MPSGHTHDSVTWFLVAPVAYAAWSVAGDAVGTGLAAASFVVAGLMLGPDLDLVSIQYRRWGRARWIWKPYQWLVPHRSIISHGLILGPLGRLVYLGLVILCVVVLGLRAETGLWSFPWDGLSRAANTASHMDVRGWHLVGYALVGMWLGSASHSLADWGWSALRRRR